MLIAQAAVGSESYCQTGEREIWQRNESWEGQITRRRFYMESAYMMLKDMRRDAQQIQTQQRLLARL